MGLHRGPARRLRRRRLHPGDPPPRAGRDRATDRARRVGRTGPGADGGLVGATRPLTSAQVAGRDRLESVGHRAIRLPAPVAVVAIALIATAIAAWGTPLAGLRVASATDRPVKILLGRASDVDPAAQGDIESAAVSAQLFESLTAIDATLQTRPALAASWDLRDGGRTVVFHLR